MGQHLPAMLEDNSQKGVQNYIRNCETDALGEAVLNKQLFLRCSALDLHSFSPLDLAAILSLIGLLSGLFIDVMHPHRFVHVLLEPHYFLGDEFQNLPTMKFTDNSH